MRWLAAITSNPQEECLSIRAWPYSTELRIRRPLLLTFGHGGTPAEAVADLGNRAELLYRLLSPKKDLTSEEDRIRTFLEAMMNDKTVEELEEMLET